MFFIDVKGPTGAKRTVAFPVAEFNIGSASDCDLQLEHEDVAAHHASIVERAGHAVVLDLGTSENTLVNGHRIYEATVMTEENELSIGPFLLRFRQVDLPPDTIQTQTVRQPSAPPIPMAEGDIEILSGPVPSKAVLSTPYSQVNSSEVLLSPIKESGGGGGASGDEASGVRMSPVPGPPVPSASGVGAKNPSTLPSQRHPISLGVSRPTKSSPSKRVVSVKIVKKDDDDDAGDISRNIATPQVHSLIPKQAKRDDNDRDDEPDPQETTETDPSIPVAQPFQGPVSSELLRASDDPVEVDYLRAIQTEEHPTEARNKYATWLEERGAIARAEYMRLIGKVHPNADPDGLEMARLRMLAKQITVAWRAAVAPRATPIERCPMDVLRSLTPNPMSTGCPKTWGALERWIVDDFRNCRVCNRAVQYLSDVELARRWASHGNPVVIEPTVRRDDNDMTDLPPSSHFLIVGRRPWDGALSSAKDAMSTTARLFANCASLEAAAVSAFERLASELEDLGAPPTLRQRALIAACDETRHANIMRTLARDERVEWPTTQTGGLFEKRSPLEIATENAVEGCVRETFGAFIAEWQSEHASCANVKRAMSMIAIDEHAHADLSWDVAAWLEPRLSNDERSRVKAARSAALKELDGIAAIDPSPEVADVAGYPMARDSAALVAKVASRVLA